MPQLENHSLARRQLSQSRDDAGTQLPVPQASLRIAGRALFLDPVGPVHLSIGGIDAGGLLFPDLPLPQMVETDVGHDPVQPGVEAAIEPERVNVPVDL